MLKVCLMLLIVLETIQIESQLSKLQRQIKEKSCFANRLKLFVELEKGTKFEFKPLKASKQIKEICPSLQYTCCSLGQVQYLRDRVLAKRDYYNDLVELASGLGQSFKMTEITREDVRKSPFEDKTEVHPLLMDKLDYYFDLIENVEEVTRTEFFKIQNSFTLMQSSIACQVCDYTFSDTLVFDSERDIEVKFNSANIETILKAIEPIVKFNDLFFGLRLINQWFLKVGEQYDQKKHKEGSALNNFIEKKYLKCKSLSIKEFEENEDCNLVLARIFGINAEMTNGWLYPAFLEEIQALDKILEFQNKHTQAEKYSKFSNKTLNMKTFPLLTGDKNWKRVYYETKGLKLQGKEMNLDKNAVMLVVYSTVCLLLSLG